MLSRLVTRVISWFVFSRCVHEWYFLRVVSTRQSCGWTDKDWIRYHRHTWRGNESSWSSRERIDRVFGSRKKTVMNGIDHWNSSFRWFPIRLDWAMFGDFLIWRRRAEEVRLVIGDVACRRCSSRCILNSIFYPVFLNRCTDLLSWIGIGTVFKSRAGNCFHTRQRMAR